MPNCFTLTRKGADAPERLQDIDNRLWTELGCTDPDPKDWYLGWYNSIGLMLACGKSFTEMLTDVFVDSDAEFLNLIRFLDKHYTPNAWYEHK